MGRSHAFGADERRHEQMEHVRVDWKVDAAWETTMPNKTMMPN
jgi:hypothetical protein